MLTVASRSAVMLTLLLPRNAKSFKISHMEMIKGMRIAGTGKALAYFDTLEIPIIENTADEEDLTGGMEAAMKEFPDSAVVLVRQHGSYNWGELEDASIRPPSNIADRLYGGFQVKHGNKLKRKPSVLITCSRWRSR